MKQDNQLQIIVKQSGLDTTKAQFILTQFQDYFAIASEWETKAKAITVTDANQTAEMQMAKVGRLFLREKRITLERARKSLKEQALREGKAIDGIANVLKALIVPIEQYLEKQEKFIEIQAAEEAERARIQQEKHAEKARLAKERAETAERERIREENEKLKAEAAERERIAAQEQRRQQAEIDKQKARVAAEKAKHEAALAAERAKKAKAIEDQKAKAAAQKAKADEKLKKEREATRIKEKAQAEEHKRLQRQLKDQIECPFCHNVFNRNQEAAA